MADRDDTGPTPLEFMDLRGMNPRSTAKVAALSPAERKRRAEYEKLRKRRQRETARRNRGHWRGYVGKDFLSEMRAIQAEGFSPAVAFDELKRRLEEAEREAAAKRAVELRLQQEQDRVHNLRMRHDSVYATSQRGRR